MIVETTMGGGGVESILTAKVVVFVLEAPFPILWVNGCWDFKGVPKEPSLDL